MAEEQFGARKEGAREWPGGLGCSGRSRWRWTTRVAAGRRRHPRHGLRLVAVVGVGLQPGRPPPRVGGGPREVPRRQPERQRGVRQFQGPAPPLELHLPHGRPPGVEHGQRPDVADVADTLEEYKSIDGYLNDIREKNKRLAEKLQIKRETEDNKNVYKLVLGNGESYTIKDGREHRGAGERGRPGPAPPGRLELRGEGATRKVALKGTKIELSKTGNRREDLRLHAGGQAAAPARGRGQPDRGR